jgi:hypothetical protein
MDQYLHVFMYSGLGLMAQDNKLSGDSLINTLYLPTRADLETAYYLELVDDMESFKLLQAVSLAAGFDSSSVSWQLSPRSV